MINKQAERGKFIKINTVYGVRWAIVSARQALDGQVNCPTWRYLDSIGRLKGADINYIHRKTRNYSNVKYK
jgi:hypothetical protein